jgi:hypothetical protein
VMYADSRTWDCCSCDLHWIKNLNKEEMPLFFRVEIVEQND